MPGKDFEQKLRDQLADFSLGSVPDVWQEVNAALHPDKKRRMPPWIFILLISVLGGTTLVWYNFQDNKNESARSGVKKESNEPSKDKDVQLKQDLSVKRPFEPVKNIPPNEAAALHKNSTLKDTDHKQNGTLETNKTLKGVDFITGLNESSNSTDPVIERLHHPETGQLNYADRHQPFSERNMESRFTSDSLNKKESSDLGQVAQVVDKKKPGWEISVVADAGISGFSNNPFSFFDNAQSGYQASLPNYDGSTGSSGSSGSPIVYKIPAYRNSFSFNAGFQARKAFDKQNSIAFELTYGLYQTKISVGRRIDTVLNNQLAGGNYYLNDSKNSYTNQYHFLQLSANYFYRFNINHKLPIRWKMGLGGAHMITSNGLHYSPSNTVLVKNNRLFNNPQLFANTGFEIGIGKKNTWYIGPQVRYFLLSSDKKTLFKNGHLSAISIGATIPLQKK